MSAFDITCPQCGQIGEADDELVGKMVDCPACGASFEVSRPRPKAIDFVCPHCGQELTGDETIVGQNVDCPACGMTFSAAHSAGLQVQIQNNPPARQRHLKPIIIIATAVVAVSATLGGIALHYFAAKQREEKKQAEYRAKQNEINSEAKKAAKVPISSSQSFFDSKTETPPHRGNEVAKQTNPEEETNSLLDYVEPFFANRVHAYFRMNQLAENCLSQPGMATNLENTIRKQVSELKAQGYSESLVRRMIGDVLSAQASKNFEKAERIVAKQIQEDRSLRMVIVNGWPVARRDDTPKRPGILERTAAAREERERRAREGETKPIRNP